MPRSSRPRTEWTHEKKQKQKLYRQREYAALNGIEDVKAVHRRRKFPFRKRSLPFETVDAISKTSRAEDSPRE